MLQHTEQLWSNVNVCVSMLCSTFPDGLEISFLHSLNPVVGEQKLRFPLWFTESCQTQTSIVTLHVMHANLKIYNSMKQPYADPAFHPMHKHFAC